MIKRLKNSLDARKRKIVDIEKLYSVFVPLIEIQDEYHLIYQVRSQYVRQPGEISFPGGHVELGESFKDAAIRETMEELNLDRHNIKYLGEGDVVVTSYGALVNTYIGLIEGIDFKDIQACEKEVDHLFTVPLKYLLENKPEIYNLSMEVVDDNNFPYHLIPNGKNYNWDLRREDIYFYKYRDYVIWGLTGRITETFVRIYKGL